MQSGNGKRNSLQSTDFQDASLQAQFWQDGAVLRFSADEYLIMAGPWENSSEAEADIGVMDFFSSEIKWQKARTTGLLTRENFRRLLESKLGSAKLSEKTFTPPSREAFEQSFRLIQGKIQREEIEKAVPIVRSHSPLKPAAVDLAHCFFKLSELPLTLNVFGFWSQGKGVLGATPEILGDWNNGLFRTMALAGSCPKAEVGTRQPLLKDSKELREHQLVVDDLIARLKPLGSLRRDPTEVLELPTLLHLKTAFELSGCTKTAGELVRHLHPTAALGVSPRGYGFQWLRELPEQGDRGWFGAPMTFRDRHSNQSRARTLVAIRSLFWSDEGSTVWAGCGLVAGSQLDREWNEVQTKIKSVFQMLSLV